MGEGREPTMGRPLLCEKGEKNGPLNLSPSGREDFGFTGEIETQPQAGPYSS